MKSLKHYTKIIRRVIVFLVCIAMIGTSFPDGSVMAAPEDDEDPGTEIYSMSLDSLCDSVEDAVNNGEAVAEDEFKFEGSSADKYEALFDTSDGLLYEIYPDLDEEGGSLTLRTFARLQESDIEAASAEEDEEGTEDSDDETEENSEFAEAEDLSYYNVTGNEEIIFLLINNTDDEVNARVHVTTSDEVYETREITVPGNKDETNITLDTLESMDTLEYLTVDEKAENIETTALRVETDNDADQTVSGNSGNSGALPVSVTTVKEEPETASNAVKTNAVTYTEGCIAMSGTLFDAVMVDGQSAAAFATTLANLGIDYGINLLAYDDSAIYLNGESGDDETGDGTEENPVATFAKAKELAEESETSAIHITGPVTVTDEETWDGDLTIYRDESFTDNDLIIVSENGNLTLQNITIDDNNISETYSLIKVEGDDAVLTINEGTVIQNNNDTSNSLSVGDEGAVCIRNGKFVMNGGTIKDNSCSGFAGGVAVIANSPDSAEMIFNGGTISGNSSQYGGGIYVAGNNAKLTMYGGTVTQNKAKNYGGGIYVGSGSEAYIYAGTISYNEQTEHEAYGGGGIYVNSAQAILGESCNAGHLYIYNVEIKDNEVTTTNETYLAQYNSTISCCQTGSLEVNVTDGQVIHDNKDGYTFFVYSDSSSSQFVLSPIMLGGGAYNWADAYGNALSLDDLIFNHAGSFYAKTSVSTIDGTVTGIDRCHTYLIGNKAVVMGSAIGTNGDVTIGKEDGDVKITIKKIWDESVAEDIRTEVRADVYAADGSGLTTCIGTVALNEDNEWTTTIENLPKYDYDMYEYIYTVVEEGSDEWVSVVEGGETECSGSDYDNDEEKTAEYEFIITNTKTEELEIGKSVEGDAATNEFTFKVTLENVMTDDGTKSTSPFEGSISAGYYMTSDPDSITPGIVTFENGEAEITLEADQFVRLNIGYGMQWKVEELTVIENGSVTIEQRGVKSKHAEYVNGETSTPIAASGTIADSTQVLFINSYRGYYDIDEEIIPGLDDADNRDSWEKNESVTEYGALEFEMSTYLPVISPEDMANEESDFTMYFHNKLDDGLKLDANEADDLHITIGGKTIKNTEDVEYYTVEILTDDHWDDSVIAPLALVDGKDECTFHVTVDLSKLYADEVINDDDLTADPQTGQTAEIIIYFYVDLEGESMDGVYTSTVQYQVFDGEEVLYTSSEDVVYVYTYEIGINKSDTKTGNPLAGATFGVYYDEACTQPVMRYGEPYTVISGEDGKVVFYGLAAGTYYLKELEAPEGYELTAEIFKIIAGTDDEFELTVGNEPAAVQQEPGSDTVSLKVTNTVKGEHTDTIFYYTVTLSDTSINGTYGGMEFVNGIATFSLGNGGEITATGLPGGIGYEVVQTAAEGFSTTVNGEAGLTASGTIDTGTATADFVNDSGSDDNGTGTTGSTGSGSSGGSSYSGSGSSHSSTGGPGADNTATESSGSDSTGNDHSESTVGADSIGELPNTGENNTAMILTGLCLALAVLLTALLYMRRKMPKDQA